MKLLSSNVRGYGRAEGHAFVVARKQAPEAILNYGEKHFLEALDHVRKDLESQAEGNPIFEAHLEMARDPMLEESVCAHISEGKDLMSAVTGACEDICAMFDGIEDEYLKSRTDDIRDIFSRIKARICGDDTSKRFEGMSEGCIVVAEDLAPSDSVMMDFNKINGIVTEKGSRTSHICIIASEHGIPVLTGVADVLSHIQEGDHIILDADSGQIVINPDEEFMERYHASFTRPGTAGMCRDEAAGSDMVPVMCNAGSISDIRHAIQSGADGIGLLRTEFLFMGSVSGWPDEESQYRAYRDAAEACQGRPLTIRTMDIGGDKRLPFLRMEHEDNPFLGLRGIRLSLAHKDKFKTQLRAILRAATSGNIKIMFPMISSAEEFAEAVSLMDECRSELAAEGTEYGMDLDTGIMIETPAAVFIADELASKADFFCIGTNDLAQYVMAADRGNTAVAALCDTGQAAVRNAIRATIEAAHRHDIPAGMCGAMASDPEECQSLKQWGLDYFSVVPPVLDLIREKLATS